MSRELTLRQRRFVDAYAGDAGGVACAAARIAGYANPINNGHRLMEIDGVRAELARRTAKEAMGPDEVLRGLGEIARADPANYEGLIGLKDADAIRAELRRLQAQGKTGAIKELVPTRNGLAVKLHDRAAALLTLARYHGLLVDRLKVSAEVDWENLSDAQLRQIIDGRP